MMPIIMLDGWTVLRHLKRMRGRTLPKPAQDPSTGAPDAL